MSCGPITEAGIWDMLNSAWDRMSIPQRRLWEVIRINPEKWEQHPYGESRCGFWVVAVLGNTVVWYNDLEHGFNRSLYSKYGEIDQYWCNQDNLEWTIQRLLNEIIEGQPSGPYASPPKPLE